MEKVCPKCEESFAAELELCPHDGTRLIICYEDPSTNLVGKTLAGRFLIERLLGQGGMGAVYRACQLSMSREVAIKVLRPSAASDPVANKRFFKEAQAASQLHHANTITVFDFGQTEDGLLFIVMELLHGRSLGDAIEEDGPFSALRAAKVMAQVCDALSEAHKQGIIHRDLKPDNIFLVQQEGNPDFVKVLDFGIAKVPVKVGETNLTAAGQVFGTPAYMSPEHALGQELTIRSDIYALGVILYEMMAGELPFQADSAMAIMLKHLQDPIPCLHSTAGLHVPQALDELLAQAMAKSSEERPATAQEFKRMLLQAVDGAAEVGAARRDGGKGKADPDDWESLPNTVVERPTGAPREAPTEQVDGLSLPKQVDAGPTVSAERLAPPRRSKAGVLLVVAALVLVAALLGVYLLQPGGPGARQEQPAAVDDDVAAGSGSSGTAGAANGAHGAGPAERPESSSERASPEGGELAASALQRPAAANAQADAGAAAASATLSASPAAAAAQEGNATAPVSGPQPPERAADPAAAAPVSEVHTVKLTSEPAGARVLLGKRVLGVTPFEWQVPAGDERISLRFKLAGHRSKTLRLEPSGEVDELHARLSPRKARRSASRATHGKERSKPGPQTASAQTPTAAAPSPPPRPAPSPEQAPAPRRSPLDMDLK